MNSCKRLGTGRLHELHESVMQVRHAFPLVSRIEFIRSKLSDFFFFFCSCILATGGARTVVREGYLVCLRGALTKNSLKFRKTHRILLPDNVKYVLVQTFLHKSLHVFSTFNT